MLRMLWPWPDLDLEKPKSYHHWIAHSRYHTGAQLLSRYLHQLLRYDIFIYSIAIVYSIHQIIKSVCVCLSVCQCVSVSVYLCVRLRALSRSHFLINFHQNWHGTDVRTPKRKNEFVRGQYRTTPSPVCPSTPHLLGQEVLETHANIT